MTPDAGTSSPDARVALDARNFVDARPNVDAGAQPDATTGADAATSADAATFADAAQSPDAAPGSDAGAVTYAHTIAIDGTNDFTPADERFGTSTTDFYTFLAWDASYLYVGVEGADIGSGSASRFVLVYLGGSGGTNIGQSYNNQEPALPFNARYHVRWRADNNLTGAQEYSASAWTDLSWDFTGDVYQTGNYLEMRIPLADIGSPTSLPIHVTLINEQSGGEWTFAGLPATSFTDGYDPDYGKYYELDIGGSTKPTAHAPK
jgi:hypothetical protein